MVPEININPVMYFFGYAEICNMLEVRIPLSADVWPMISDVRV